MELTEEFIDCGQYAIMFSGYDKIIKNKLLLLQIHIHSKHLLLLTNVKVFVVLCIKSAAIESPCGFCICAIFVEDHH